MDVVTAAEMREIDRVAMEEYGIPGVVLMENAGKKVVDAVCQHFEGCVKGKVITIFVGKGNNGGDGLVVARHLLNKGADVRVLMVADPEQLTGDAAVNLNIWDKMGQRLYQVHQPNGINMVKVSLMSTHLIVDAMYGTGFRGAANDKLGRIIELINSSDLPVISVDIPSGLEADTGLVHGPCVKANITVTFGLPKLGMVLEPGKSFTGNMVVADISLPKPLLWGSKVKLLQSKMVRQWLPQRKSDAHKGDFGRVLVVAGSVGMGGAAVLATTACIRSGAGLVTLAMPQTLHDGIVGAVPEVMTLPLPQSEGVLTDEALDLIVDKMQQVDVLAIGPGLTQRDETVQLVQQLLPYVNIPVVIDADGLNAMAKDITVLERIAAPVVLTPHPGEMARLLNLTVKEVQNNRISLVQQSAERWGCTVLLKGARTLIASSDGKLYINPTGNTGMATAGSGDVLTGVIAALLAQGLPPAEAAAAGAYLHGMAGDAGASQLGMYGLSARDILHNLPKCFKDVEVHKNTKTNLLWVRERS